MSHVHNHYRCFAFKRLSVPRKSEHRVLSPLQWHSDSETVFPDHDPLNSISPFGRWRVALPKSSGSGQVANFVVDGGGTRWGGNSVRTASFKTFLVFHNVAVDDQDNEEKQRRGYATHYYL